MTAVEHLIEAIGYPDKAPAGVKSFLLRVDGAEIPAVEDGGKLIVSLALTADENAFAKLAEYALGRMLREEATLAYGRQPGREGGNFASGAFLWQSVAADAGDLELERFFETFMNSCDWWRERVDALRETEGESVPEMMIRP